MTTKLFFQALTKFLMGLLLVGLLLFVPAGTFAFPQATRSTSSVSAIGLFRLFGKSTLLYIYYETHKIHLGHCCRNHD